MSDAVLLCDFSRYASRVTSHVEQRARLGDLAVREVRDDLRDELDHLEVVQVREVPGGLREEKVAGEDGDACAVERVDCLANVGVEFKGVSWR